MGEDDAIGEGYERHGVRIEFVVEDIAGQKDFDAVVNAANAQLRTGGGVAGALHRAAGPGLEEECRPLAPIRPGECVVTSGHDLPNRYVIHCLGPVYGVDTPSEDLLRACYRGALEAAESHAMQSVAFPALSTGAFGYPMEAAAHAALSEIASRLPELRSVRRIRFVLFDEAARDLHESVFRAHL